MGKKTSSWNWKLQIRGRTDVSLSGIWYWELSDSHSVGNRLSRNEEGNYCLAEISPDGANIAAGNQSMKVGNLEIGTSWFPISENNDWIRAISYSPDGKLIAYSGDDPTIHIWDTQSKSERCKLEGHTERVESLSFFPDSHKIASSSDDATIRIWDMNKQSTNIKLINPTINPKEFAFSPNDAIAAYIQGNLVILTDASFSNSQRTLVHESKVNCFCWTTDGTQIVSSTEDGQIHFWNPWTEGHLKSIDSKQNICCLASSDMGGWTISGSKDGKVYKWDFNGQPMELILHKNPPPMAISCVTISSNGYLVAAASYDAAINVWHGHTGELIRRHIPDKIAQWGFMAWGESHIHVLAFSENNDNIFMLQTEPEGSVLQLKWNLKTNNNKPQVISSIVGDVKAIAQGTIKHQWLALGRSPDTVIIDTKDENKRIAFFSTQLSYLVTAPYCGLWANLKGTQFSVFQLERYLPKQTSIMNDLDNKNKIKSNKLISMNNSINMQQPKYKISFFLLLENESVMKYKSTIDSISDFVNNSPIVDKESSEILCITGVEEANSNFFSQHLRLISPSKWILPFEKETRIAPEIMHQFGMATNRTGNSLIIIVEPGSCIRDITALESAIKNVDANDCLIAISYNIKKSSYPNSAILSTSTVMMRGVTSGAASFKGVKVKKRLFGGINFLYQNDLNKADVPWLIAAIAVEYERDIRHQGFKVNISCWT